MLISHETPLSLLEQSRDFNDYDYALVHLFEESEEYYDFFRKSLKLGRKIILDNSIFELGVAFNSDEFADWVNRLKPTEYIVPDVLENKQGTIDNFNNFNYKNKNLTKIGVVQGSTLQEIFECYIFMSKAADKIAISFDYSVYTLLFPNEINKWFSFMKGRQYIINQLINNRLWNWDKPHHLLGCSLPQEFKYYKDIKNIETIDTSNPVIMGLLNYRYNPDTGLEHKETIKVADLFTTYVDEKALESIKYNVNIFRSFCN